MKSFASINLGSLGSVSFQHSISTTSDRPAGISPDAWIRLDENLGIVINAPPIAATAAAPPAATGYLMVKRGGAWLRLNLEAQAAV